MRGLGLNLPGDLSSITIDCSETKHSHPAGEFPNLRCECDDGYGWDEETKRCVYDIWSPSCGQKQVFAAVAASFLTYLAMRSWD